MGKIIRNGIEFSSTVDTANNISYDNSLSGLEATTTQKAIDEVNKNVSELTESLVAEDYTAQMTAGTNFSFLEKKLVVKNNRAVLNASGIANFKTANKKTIENAITIPSEIAPSFSITSGARAYYANGVITQVGAVILNSNGNITLATDTANDAVYFGFNITWDID